MSLRKNLLVAILADELNLIDEESLRTLIKENVDSADLVGPDKAALEQSLSQLSELIESELERGGPVVAMTEGMWEAISGTIDVNTALAAAVAADGSVETRSSDRPSHSPRPRSNPEPTDPHATLGPSTETGSGQLGRYELIKQVGEGSFGAVWKARDQKLGRIVALKILGRARKGADLDADREARAAAHLDHPNIASVYETGEARGSYFVVTEFVEGTSLRSWLDEREGVTTEVLEVFVKIARALSHAHQANVVHRDLKPANILVNNQSEPFLIDFGLARRQGEATMTATRAVLGTPVYMSPEQASGKSHYVDGGSDIFSFGVMLYEAITGELPFRGADPHVLMHQIRSTDPTPPRRLNPRIDRDLETICMTCLEKDARHRYSHAEQLADDLQRFVEGHPISQRPVGPIGRAWRWYRRNPRATRLIAGTFLLCYTSLLTAWGLVGVGYFLVHGQSFGVIEISLTILFWYVPMAICGYYTLIDRLWAVICGLLLLLVIDAWQVTMFFGLPFPWTVTALEPTLRDTFVKISFWSLWFLLTSLGVIFYLIALNSILGDRREQGSLTSSWGSAGSQGNPAEDPTPAPVSTVISDFQAGNVDSNSSANPE